MGVLIADKAAARETQTSEHEAWGPIHDAARRGAGLRREEEVTLVAPPTVEAAS